MRIRRRKQEPRPESNYVMGLGSLWVVTQSDWELAHRLAKHGEPHPRPEIGHIIYLYAAFVVARQRWWLIGCLAAVAIAAGAAVALIVAGKAGFAITVIVVALLGAGVIVFPHAYDLIEYSRLRRANRSAA